MFKKLTLTFFLLLGSYITIYPSKKESTNLIDYCYSFEKIIFRNSLDNSKNLSKKYKTFAKDIDEYINDINSEYNSIKKEINKFF